MSDSATLAGRRQPRSAMSDRREALRHLTLRPTCEIAAVVGGRSCSAQIRDLSEDGAGLAVESAPEPGELFTLALSDRTGRISCTTLAWVIHASPLEDGHYAVGFQFTQPLDSIEVRRLLA